MDFKKILNDEELKQKDKLIEQVQLDQKEKNIKQYFTKNRKEILNSKIPEIKTKVENIKELFQEYPFIVKDPIIDSGLLIKWTINFFQIEYKGRMEFWIRLNEEILDPIEFFYFMRPLELEEYNDVDLNKLKMITDLEINQIPFGSFESCFQTFLEETKQILVKYKFRNDLFL